MATPNNIAVPNEVDAWVVTLQPNTPYLLSVTGATGGASTGNTLPNPFVGVADLNTSNVVAVQDDTTSGGLDPRLDFQVPASGNYLVMVSDLTGGTGSYTIGVYDQQGNLQPGSFVIDIVVDPATVSGTPPGGSGPPPGPPPGSFGPPPGGFSPIPPGQPGGSFGNPAGGPVDPFSIVGQPPANTDPSSFGFITT